MKLGTVGKNTSAGMKLRGSVGVAMMAIVGGAIDQKIL